MIIIKIMFIVLFIILSINIVCIFIIEANDFIIKIMDKIDNLGSDKE